MNDPEDSEVYNGPYSNTSGIGLIGLLILGLVGWWLYGLWFSQTWNAYIYTDSSKSVIGTVKKTGFSSYDDCLDGVVLYRRSGGSYYSHECGKNCKTRPGSVIDICSETR